MLKFFKFSRHYGCQIYQIAAQWERGGGGEGRGGFNHLFYVESIKIEKERSVPHIKLFKQQ